MSDISTGSGFSVPTFDDDKPKTPRNPRKKAPAKAASKLIEAVDFISHASDPKSKYTWQQFGRFVGGWAMATNGSMRAGHPIEEDLTICPHLGLLRSALVKAGASVAMTALDAGRLSVVGGALRVVVPCAPGDTLPPAAGHPPIAPLDDRVKAGFAALLKLAKDEADTLYESSFLLRANTVVGCNGNLAMEFWHGNDLPVVNIPHAFAKAIVSIPKKLTGFGWQEGRSVTFHFEDGSWLATQLKEGTWPEAIDRVLNADKTLEDCPPKLFEALETIAEFSKDGAVHFHEDKLKTSYSSIDAEGNSVYGATYDVPGLIGGHSFTANLLKLAKPGCAKIDYTTNDDRLVFYNEEAMLRGVLMKRIA